MTTPLEQFSNARLLFTAPGGRGGPETGFQELPGQQYIVLGFLKQVTANKRADFKDHLACQQHWHWGQRYELLRQQAGDDVEADMEAGLEGALDESIS